jgi:hypothetical protein
MGLGLTDRLQRGPSNGSEKHRGTPRFCACTHAMQHACPEGCAYAAMRGCSPLLNHAMARIGRGWDLVSRIGSSKTHQRQQETTGSSPFPRECSLCTVHILSAGSLQRCTDARPGQSTQRARMGVGLTDWSHKDPLNGGKKTWGALHFRARTCYEMFISGGDAILKSE